MNWFQKLFGIQQVKPVMTGALLPSVQEIMDTPHFDEIVAGAASSGPLFSLDVNNLPSWPIYNQGYTLSCVANADCLADTVIYFLRNGKEIKFSPAWKYRHRVNYPEGGMIGTDISKIDKTLGSLPYDLLPTPKTEIEMNNIKVEDWLGDIAKIFVSQDDKIIVPIKDFDTLISIQRITGKPIDVWFEFSEAEWTFNPFISNAVPDIHHAVSFVPSRDGARSYGVLPSGEPAIVIQDSAFPATSREGKRIITKSFYEKRNIFATYKMRFKFEVNPAHLHWDGTVISLQKCLRSLGMFPTNVDFFDAIGPVTRQSLLKYQTARGLPQTSNLDEITRASLTKEF